MQIDAVFEGGVVDEFQAVGQLDGNELGPIVPLASGNADDGFGIPIDFALTGNFKRVVFARVSAIGDFAAYNVDTRGSLLERPNQSGFRLRFGFWFRFWFSTWFGLRAGFAFLGR